MLWTSVFTSQRGTNWAKNESQEAQVLFNSDLIYLTGSVVACVIVTQVAVSLSFMNNIFRSVPSPHRHRAPEWSALIGQDGRDRALIGGEL